MSEFHDIRQDARLEALERRVMAIMNHLDIPDPVPAAPAGVSARVAELARSGHQIEAIREQMRETGADLRAARDAVAAIT